MYFFFSHLFFFIGWQQRCELFSYLFFKSAPSFFHHLVFGKSAIFIPRKSLSNDEPAQNISHGFQNVGVTKAMGTSTCGFFQCLATIGSFGCDAKWGHVDDRWLPPFPPAFYCWVSGGGGLDWYWLQLSTWRYPRSPIFFWEVEEFGGVGVGDPDTDISDIHLEVS